MSTSTKTISQKILFVDDEMLLLEGLKRQLRRDFDISVALGGAAALTLAVEQGPFAVIVSDYNMPGMDGIAFLKTIYQHDPHTVLIMLTGRAELDVAVSALHNAHISRFLNKPCPREILLETLTDGLEQYRLKKTEQLLQTQLQEANQRLNQMNDQLEVLVDKKTRALQLQYRYATSMAQMTYSSAVIDAFVQSVIELTAIRTLSLWLSPQQNGQFTCHYPGNSSLPEFDSKNCPAGLIATAISQKTIWRIDNEESKSASCFDQSVFNGNPFMSVPLQGSHGVLGLLNLAGDDLVLSDDSLEALVGMSDVTATALQSHWHREANDEAQDAIITALAKLSKYRDPETGAHLLRLKKYSELICRFLAKTDKYRDIVTEEFTKDLVRSTPLHDIGKVGISDAILKKPGRLTEDEFEIMKTHAAIGGDTLRAVYENYPSQNFIKCGMDVAYSHHEKWNGSGYPQGLKGEAIPLPARILALVDVYDALTCRRVYKPAFPREKANSIIAEGRGIHFDPDIVSAFLINEAQFYIIAEEYADLV
jgi:response regulator RpfG family c-di-GMP phosphodiesterase